MKTHSLLKGTFILATAGLVAKFLGIFFRWPLIMLIGDEGIGYYQMSYPLYTFFIAVASGIPVAISKLISERRAVQDMEGIIQVFKKSILVMFIIGGGFTAFLLIFSKRLVNIFGWEAKSYYSLLGIALAPMFISLMSAFRGFFQGLQYMTPTAWSQLIEQVGRVVFGVGLAIILLPKGIEYSAGGAAFGATAGGIFGTIYLFYKYMKIKKELKIGKVRRNLEVLNRLLLTAIPISVGATVISIMSLIDSFLVPRKLLEAGLNGKEATILYGQLTGKAFVLVNVPLTVSMGLCLSLVPIITECFILNRRGELISKIETAMKFSMVVAIPSFLGLFVLAKPILELVFPGHSEGYPILRYLSVSIPFIVIFQTSTSILQGVDKYRVPVRNLMVGCIIKFIITFMLVPIAYINIYGAIIGTIVGYIISSIMNLKSLEKSLGLNISYYDIIIKPAYASVLMIIAVIFIYEKSFSIFFSNGLACIISIFSGVLIYTILVIMLKIMNYKYVKERLRGNKRREL